MKQGVEWKYERSSVLHYKTSGQGVGEESDGVDEFEIMSPDLCLRRWNSIWSQGEGASKFFG